MPTLVLSPRQTPDSQALWRAAIARGWDVHRLSSWRIEPALLDASEPLLYVEALVGPMLAESLGVTLLDPPEDWLCTLPDEYRRRDVQLSTLGDARTLRSPAFVKPPNDKSFPAAVYEPCALPRDFDDAMSVLVSEPVRFECEFRCFVLDRRVKTLSLYCRDGESCPDGTWTDAETAALTEFTDTLLADERVALPRACVLDCGLIADRGWAAVELNAAWGAGIYQCDPDAVLDVVRAATVE